MPSEPTGLIPAVARLRLRLDLGHGLGREQVGPQMAVEHRVSPAQPFEGHGRMLLLLVAVVGQDVGQARVLRGLDPLVVPVDGLELLDRAT